MVKWVRDWFMLAAMLMLGAGMLLMFWAIWPLLPGRFPTELLAFMDLEGLIAIGMLLVILVGFGKLLCLK